MTSLIVLAFAFLVFSVQGSSINGEVLESEHEFDNDRDTIIDRQIQDEFQDTEKLDRRELKEASLKCMNTACTVCQGVYCLFLGYFPNDNDFDVSLTYFTSTLYQEKIKAMDWDKCMQLKIVNKLWESCVRIENVRINGSRACVNLNITSDFMTQSVSDVCM